MKHVINNKHWDLVKDYNIDKMLYLLIDRPDEISSFNSFLWKNKKQFHRDYDLPSYISNDKHVCWWKNNKRYRGNYKPAVIRYNGEKEYWTNEISY